VNLAFALQWPITPSWYWWWPALVRYNQSQINLLAALGLIDQTNIEGKPSAVAGQARGTVGLRPKVTWLISAGSSTRTAQSVQLEPEEPH
jgi:hypothetical protein